MPPARGLQSAAPHLSSDVGSGVLDRRTNLLFFTPTLSRFSLPVASPLSVCSKIKQGAVPPVDDSAHLLDVKLRM